MPSVLDPQGPIGVADKTIMINSVAIMLAIIVPTAVAILAFAWWFRAGNAKARYRPNWVYSGRVEMVVWSIPLLTIMLLGGVDWIGSHQLDPAVPIPSKSAPLQVQVVSLDWKWLFIYPGQQVASVNQLVIPVGVPVHFAITSGSVMTAFFIPQLGSMIYAMNGMRTELNLEADKAGDYWGEAAHFSGDGFAGMHFDVRAVDSGQFASWAQQAQHGQEVLDEAGYRQLSRQSMDVPPTTFRVTDPALFQEIVSQKIPPGPGPETGNPSPSVHPEQGQ